MKFGFVTSLLIITSWLEHVKGVCVCGYSAAAEAAGTVRRNRAFELARKRFVEQWKRRRNCTIIYLL